MRQRVQCIILEDKKILLVKDRDAAHYYPPGGGIETNETHQEAIQRELKEELNVDTIKTEFHSSYQSTNEIRKHPQTEHNYLVEIKGTPTPSSEIEEIKWFSWEEIEKKMAPFPKNLYTKLFMKLREEKMI
ncbi:NUDIX domain-containing protein [Candidatus Woesearchaeota archaeon]|nr:NUDIX domain-containing protein [Candidatus Woesearchaeota archaeon]